VKNQRTNRILLAAWCGIALVALAATLNRSPITRGYLTTNLDGNGKYITNLAGITDTNGDPITGGGGGSVTGSYAFNAVYPLTNNVSGTTVTYGVVANYSNGILATAGAVATNADATLSNNIVAIIASEIGALGSASSNMTEGASNKFVADLAGKVDELNGFATNLNVTYLVVAGWLHIPDGTSNPHPATISQLSSVSNELRTADGTLSNLVETLGLNFTNDLTTLSNKFTNDLAGKLDIGGGNAADVVTIGPLSTDATAQTITLSGVEIDVTGLSTGIQFGTGMNDFAIRSVSGSGIAFYNGATAYALFNGSVFAFGTAPPTSAVAADSTGEIVRWDEWSGVNTAISNSIAAAGANITNTFRPRRETFQIFLTGGTNALTVGTNAVHWMVPYAMQITGAVLAVHPSFLPTGTQIRATAHVNGTNFFSTPLHIDATERTSLTAETNYVFAFTNHHRLGDSFTFETLQIGGTLPGNGLFMTLYGQEVFP